MGLGRGSLGPGPLITPGQELDVKELAATFNVNVVGSANMVDVAGMGTLQFAMPAFGPVYLDLLAPAVTVDTAAKLMVLSICKPDNTVVAQFSNAVVAANVGAQIRGLKRLTTADFAAGALVQLKLRAHVQAGAAAGALLATLLAPLTLRALGMDPRG